MAKLPPSSKAPAPAVPAWLDQVQKFDAPQLESNPNVSTRDPAVVGPALGVIAEAIPSGGDR